MNDHQKVAVIQMASGPNIPANLHEADQLISEAAGQGAKLVVLPENFAFMGDACSDMLDHKEVDRRGPIQDFLAAASKKYGVWIVGGTLPLVCDRADKVRAACMVFDDNGERVARYDKIHLFDVTLVETNEEYNESRTIDPGDHVVVVDSPLGRLGVSVCYDLRFPELYRAMLDKGAEIFVLPAAFTAMTGKAHWEPLLRTRAIENLCYVVAAAQGGYHVNGRETHGDSMVVDPWGTVLNRRARGNGVVIAELDRSRLDSTRRNFPTIEHRRLHCN